VQRGIRLDDDVLVRVLLELVNQDGLARLQRLGNFRMNTQREVRPFVFRRSHLPSLCLNLVAQRGDGLHHARPVQYGQGWHSTRSSACLVRLRVMHTSPNSLNESAFDGALSCSSADCSAISTFSRFLRSSISMKSTTMMPPRSRKRICRTISFTASRLVLTMVSSRRVEPLPTNFPVLTSMATSASVWLMTM